MIHGRQPEVESFLFWRGFSPYQGQKKLFLMTVACCYKRDNVKTLQKGKNSISGCMPFVAEKRLCLSFLIPLLRRPLKSDELFIFHVTLFRDQIFTTNTLFLRPVFKSSLYHSCPYVFINLSYRMYTLD